MGRARGHKHERRALINDITGCKQCSLARSTGGHRAKLQLKIACKQAQRAFLASTGHCAQLGHSVCPVSSLSMLRSCCAAIAELLDKQCLWSSGSCHALATGDVGPYGTLLPLPGPHLCSAHPARRWQLLPMGRHLMQAARHARPHLPPVVHTPCLVTMSVHVDNGS